MLDKKQIAVDNLESRGKNVSGSLIRELANDAMGRDGLIPLWFGEPDKPTPGFICDAAYAAMHNGETFYTESLGRPYLREAIAGYMSSLYSVPVSSDRIAVTTSGGNAINLAFQALLQPGDKVVLTSPGFPNLAAIPKLQDATLSVIDLKPHADGWRLDLDRLIDQTKNAKAVLINSPANPTGWMMNESEQQTLLDECRKTGTWIIADDVYARLCLNRSFAPSFAQLANAEDRVIIVNSFSKSWAMTGWRLGWLTLPESLTPLIAKITEFSVACAPDFSQRAGVTALEQGEEFVQQFTNDLKNAHDYLRERFSECEQIFWPKTESTFYAYFQIKNVEDSVTFARRLIDQAGIGLAPGKAFDANCKDWFRLCFAQSPQTLEQAADRLIDYLSKC